jgi:heterotetrameric sarcosine oxidase gamma subunit
MSTRPHAGAPGGVELTVHDSAACLEFVAPRVTDVAALGFGWPAAPGAVRRAPDGRIELLHVASGRWLAPEPTAGLRDELAARADEGLGAVVDVEGKWRHLTFAGAGAARLLASGTSLAGVLAARDCALLRLFDAPVVLARDGDRFEAWVQASYLASFRAQLEAVVRRNARG